MVRDMRDRIPTILLAVDRVCNKQADPMVLTMLRVDLNSLYTVQTDGRSIQTTPMSRALSHAFYGRETRACMETLASAGAKVTAQFRFELDGSRGHQPIDKQFHSVQFWSLLSVAMEPSIFDDSTALATQLLELGARFMEPSPLVTISKLLPPTLQVLLRYYRRGQITYLDVHGIHPTWGQNALHRFAEEPPADATETYQYLIAMGLSPFESNYLGLTAIEISKHKLANERDEQRRNERANAHMLLESESICFF